MAWTLLDRFIEATDLFELTLKFWKSDAYALSSVLCKCFELNSFHRIQPGFREPSRDHLVLINYQKTECRIQTRSSDYVAIQDCHPHQLRVGIAY